MLNMDEIIIVGCGTTTIDSVQFEPCSTTSCMFTIGETSIGDNLPEDQLPKTDGIIVTNRLFTSTRRSDYDGINIDAINLVNAVQELKSLVQKQQEQIDQLKTKLTDIQTHIEFMPSGLGYHSAQNEFNNMVNSLVTDDEI